MRTPLVALALVAAMAAATLEDKDEMLSSNRIPEHTQKALGSACGECKTIVHGIVEAIDDPQKLAALKILLFALCSQTPFVTECKMFVSTIEIFIKEIEPYLRDEEAVCKKMHLCANAKLTNFHRIGQLYLEKERIDGKDSTNDFACDECQMALIELKKVVDDENERAAVKALFEKICKHMGKYEADCDLMVETFLPEIWKELDTLLANPKAACSQIGFCAKQAGLPANKIAAFYNGLKNI